MSWKKVGEFLKDNGGKLLGLAGAIATGGTSAAIATVASMVAEATGEQDPGKALAKLQTDPTTMARLEEIAAEKEKSIRDFHVEMLRLQLADGQAEHTETQTTIREGDKSGDEYVRRTRPKMARESWYGSMAYIFTTEIGSRVGLAFSVTIPGANWEIATTLMAPALTYMGMRTADKVFGTKLTEKVFKG